MTFIASFYVSLGTILGHRAGLSRSKLLLTYLKISGRFILLVRLLRWNLKNETVCGYGISLPSYDEFHFLLHEIFVHQQYLFQTAKRQPYIIDCGSHIGLAVLYFKLLYPEAIITAIEPSPNAIPYLRSNVERNQLRDVEIRQVAAWTGKGTMRLYFSETEPGGLTSSLMLDHFPAGERLASAEVECVPLSDLVERPVDLLKLDVEGAELAIVEELCESGKIQYVERLLVEFHHRPEDSALPDFLHLLHANGLYYRVAAPYELPSSILDPDRQQGILISAWRENKDSAV